MIVYILEHLNMETLFMGFPLPQEMFKIYH